jgi:hypothetical protein
MRGILLVCVLVFGVAACSDDDTDPVRDAAPDTPANDAGEDAGGDAQDCVPADQSCAGANFNRCCAPLHCGESSRNDAGMVCF